VAAREGKRWRRDKKKKYHTMFRWKPKFPSIDKTKTVSNHQGKEKKAQAAAAMRKRRMLRPRGKGGKEGKGRGCRREKRRSNGLAQFVTKKKNTKGKER